MNLTITIIGVILVVVAIWVFLELKRFRHRILAVFLIALVLFVYFSFLLVFHGKTVDLSSIDGIKQAGGIYFSWLGSAFGNVKSLTANAVNMNWSDSNSTNISNSTNLTKS